jgi:hypothetical protein
LVSQEPKKEVPVIEAEKAEDEVEDEVEEEIDEAKPIKKVGKRNSKKK